MSLTIELTDEQIQRIADVVADRLGRPQGSEILTVAEASKIAKVSTETVRRWVRAQRLPSVSGTRSIRIPRRSLEGLLNLNDQVEARRDGAPLPEKTSPPLPHTSC